MLIRHNVILILRVDRLVLRFDINLIIGEFILGEILEQVRVPGAMHVDIREGGVLILQSSFSEMGKRGYRGKRQKQDKLGQRNRRRRLGWKFKADFLYTQRRRAGVTYHDGLWAGQRPELMLDHHSWGWDCESPVCLLIQIMT